MDTKLPEIKNARYSASEVADYFVYLASQKMIDENVPEGVTPLKLQKFLYFAQSASLSLLNTRIFKEDIEAWKYGPVVEAVYKEYKKHGNNAVVKPSGIYKKITDKEVIKIISGVWGLFDRYSASELVSITHNHTPWKEAFEKSESDPVIHAETLRDYYKDIFEFTEEDGQEANA